MTPTTGKNTQSTKLVADQNKIPVLESVSLQNTDHPINTNISALSGFISEAIAEWPADHLESGRAVLDDG